MMCAAENSLNIDLIFPLDEKKYIDMAETLRESDAHINKNIFINLKSNSDVLSMTNMIERKKLQRIFDAYSGLNIFMVRLIENTSTSDKLNLCYLKNNVINVEYDHAKYRSQPYTPLNLPQNLTVLRVHSFDESTYKSIKNISSLAGLFIDVIDTNDDMVRLIDLLKTGNIMCLHLYYSSLFDISPVLIEQFIVEISKLDDVVVNMCGIDNNLDSYLKTIYESETLKNVGFVMNEKHVGIESMRKFKEKFTKFTLLVKDIGAPTKTISL